MSGQTGQIKRFLTVFGLIVLYMIAWAPVLYVWVLIWGENDTAIAIGVLVAMVLIVIGLVPFMDFVAKKVFRFPGQGDPVPEEALRSMISDINQFDVPVQVLERDKTLVVTWRYVDARWWEILARAGLKKLYELHIKLDDENQVATLIDVQKSVTWSAGPSHVRVYGGFFRGIVFAYEIGQAWGIRENFQLGKLYEYRFSPEEIKTPVMNSILRSGWTVRFGLW